MSRSATIDEAARGLTALERRRVDEELAEIGASPAKLAALEAELYQPDVRRSGGRFGADVARVLRLALTGVKAELGGDPMAWSSTEAGAQGLQDSGRIEIGDETNALADPSYQRARAWIRDQEQRQAKRVEDDAARIEEKMMARAERQKENEQRGTIPGLVIPPAVTEE